DIARYNEISGDLLAYGKPIMKALDQGDSLFIKADTFFSAYLPLEEDSLSSQDSLNLTADFIRSLAAANAMEDTLGTDTAAGSGTIVDSTRISIMNGVADVIADTIPTIQPETPAAISDSIRQHIDSTSSALKSRMDNLVYAREVIKQAD